MNLNSEQSQALTAMLDYVRANTVPHDDDVFSPFTYKPIKPFIFTGLAGTGKTTVTTELIKTVISHGIIPADKIAVVAYTGKAASVINKKLGKIDGVGATTIHKLLYTTPIDAIKQITNQLDKLESDMDDVPHTDVAKRAAMVTERGNLMEELRKARQKGSLRFGKRSSGDVRSTTQLIIVDEASMVDSEIAADLANINVPVIYVGDSNQLPPVGKSFGIALNKPDARLTTIMRQAGDSSIIPLAHEILKVKKVPSSMNGEEGVTITRNTNPLAFIKDGQIPQFVTFYNNSRHDINFNVRVHHLKVDKDDEYSYLPFIGETVMLDANIHEARLMKGDLLIVRDIALEAFAAEGSKFSGTALALNPMDYYRAVGVFEDQYGTIHNLPVFLNDLMLSMRDSRALQAKDNDDYRKIMRYSHDCYSIMFPYAITCYKAQGSEWDSVVVLDEKPKNSYLPYIYTAVTRARSNLTVAGVRS